MMNGRLHRFSLAVTLAVVTPSFCSASSLAELGTLHQTLVGEENFEVRPLIVAPVESGVRLEPPEKTAAIREVFPTEDKARVQALFASARWDFRPDGTFRFTPAGASVAEDLSLEGNYQRIQEAIEIHALRRAAGFVASLDGIFHESREGYRLEAVYSWLSGFSAPWLVEIRQEIHPGPPPPSKETIVAWVAGIPVPSTFEVTLEGKMDGRELPEATGLVTIRHPDRKYLGPVAIKLDARSPGWNAAGRFLWMPPTAKAGDEEARISIRNGNVSVEINAQRSGDSTVLLTAPVWLGTRLYGDVTQEAVWGRLTLTVLGDEASGELLATTSRGDKYQGVIKGRRSHTSYRLPASLPSDPERESSRGEPVGSWLIQDGKGTKVGDLSLQRGEEGVIEGQIVINGILLTLAGSEQSGLLELGEPGSGLAWRLRLLPGGSLLLGFEYGVKNVPFRAFVARRTNLLANSSGPTASSPEELIARFSAGLQLASQGSCQEATEGLEDVLLGLSQLPETDKDLPQVLRTVSYQMLGLTASLLATCDLQAGDHDGFLRHLRAASNALTPLREAEHKAAIESIDDLLAVLKGPHSQIDAIGAGLDELCHARNPTLYVDNTSLASAVARANAEIDEFDEKFSAQLSELESLRARLSERRVSTRDGLKELRSLRLELRESVQAAFARLAAANQDALRQEPRLSEARDRLWASIDLLSETPSQTGRLPFLMQNFSAATEKERRAGPPERSLGLFQVLVGVNLLLLEIPLREEFDFWAFLQEFPPAVQAASELATGTEDWRRRFSTDQGKIAALQRLETFFADLILLLLEEGEVSDALAVSEIARSRAFVDLLAGRDEIRRYIDESSLKDNDRVLPSPTTVAPPALEDVLETVRHRGSTTVEYFLAEDRVVIWAVSPEGKVFAASEPIDRAALRSTVDELHALLEGRSGANGGSAPPDAVRTRQLLRELHRLLIDPIPSDRLPQTAEEALTIIPHQELFAVPFAALEDEQGRRLIERHPVVYGTSVASLGAIQRNRSGRRAEAPLRLLALVNPSPLPGRSDGGTFPPLDELEQGFSRIAEIYPAPERMVLTRGAATLEALRAHGAGAGALHLVTHAEFVEQDPLASFIALAGEDGALRVPEVFRLDLAADLVILWACETGRGGLSADGVEGLSRGFTWAGASSLLLSLWEIPDTESLVQMEGFHHFWLRQGFSKARALQKAQVEYSRLYPDQPGLWAGLVLYGEAE